MTNLEQEICAVSDDDSDDGILTPSVIELDDFEFYQLIRAKLEREFFDDPAGFQVALRRLICVS